jgi:hypothetical protein
MEETRAALAAADDPLEQSSLELRLRAMQAVACLAGWSTPGVACRRWRHALPLAGLLTPVAGGTCGPHDGSRAALTDHCGKGFVALRAAAGSTSFWAASRRSAPPRLAQVVGRLTTSCWAGLLARSGRSQPLAWVSPVPWSCYSPQRRHVSEHDLSLGCGDPDAGRPARGVGAPAWRSTLKMIHCRPPSSDVRRGTSARREP